MPTRNRLDLQTLGSQPIIPIISPVTAQIPLVLAALNESPIWASQDIGKWMIVYNINMDPRWP